MKTSIEPELTQDWFARKTLAHKGWFEVFIGDFRKYKFLLKGKVDTARGYDARVSQKSFHFNQSHDLRGQQQLIYSILADNS